MLHFATSHLGLHFMPISHEKDDRLICVDIEGKLRPHSAMHVVFHRCRIIKDLTTQGFGNAC